MGAFFRELQRRRVLRVAALYMAAAWALFQLADIFFPGWGLPEAALNYVLLAVGLGFPLALVFGWRFDITADGIVRTPPLRPEMEPDRSLRLNDYLTLGVLLVAAGLIVMTAVTKLEDSATERGRPASDDTRKAVAVLQP